MKKVINIRRVSSFRGKDDTSESVPRKGLRSSPITIRSNSGDATPDTASPMRGCSSGRETPCEPEEQVLAKGQKRINTLWGNCIKNYAKMCIPDLDVLVDYPIDYKYPIFSRDQQGDVVTSGFFPADPVSLHVPQLVSLR